MDPNESDNPATDESRATVRRSRLRGRFVRLCMKELRETLRDRRTIITLVLMPLLVYPLLSILFLRLQTLSPRRATNAPVLIGFTSEEEKNTAETYLAMGDLILDAEQAVDDESATGGTSPLPDNTPLKWVIAEDLERAVKDGEIDLGLRVRPATLQRPRRGRIRQVTFELLYGKINPSAQAAIHYLEHRLTAFNEKFLIDRLALAGVKERPPTVTEHKTIAVAQAPVSLTTLIPLILILMTITGAVYPAIDLTAGERERGTLETLMAAPVPRLALLSAKYVAVVVVALMTAVANLAAMTITLTATGLAAAVFGEAGLTWVLVLQVLGLLVLFAAFFSAILLAVTSFARSFKEAQAYLIPLMLLALAPGMLSLLPQLKFNAFLSIVPLVNIVLLARDLAEGQLDLTLGAAAVCSTAVYAVGALALAARIFGTDAILYGSQSSWSDVFRPVRRPVPPLSAALLWLALLFPLYFLSANSLAHLTTLSPAGRLIASGLTTIVLFLVLPLVAARLQGASYVPTFRLEMPRAPILVASFVLGLSLWPFAHEVFLLNRQLGLNPLTGEQVRAVAKLLASWEGIPFPLILITLAVIPAVAEEFFFRGYLFSAASTRLSATTTILLTALLFGVFHVVVTSMLSLERLLPSTFLGVILGWLCWRSGSAIPGMVLHVTHNGLLLTIVFYRDALMAWGWAVAEDSHLPWTWLLASVITVVGALIWLVFLTTSAADADTPTNRLGSVSKT